MFPIINMLQHKFYPFFYRDFWFPSSFLLIFFIQANVTSGSPGLFGILTFGPFKSLTILFTLTVLPLPTLKISPIKFLFLLTLIIAPTMSDTKVKSRVCSPFPTIVKGFLQFFEQETLQIPLHMSPKF